MIDILNRVLLVAQSGQVERCHTIPHLGSYKTAEHQWGVAILLFQLWPADFARIGIHALTHDVPEYWTGDIPSPTFGVVAGLKKNLGNLEMLLAEELEVPNEYETYSLDHWKLKFCDRFEMLLWCKRQVSLGNVSVCKIMFDLETGLREMVNSQMSSYSDTAAPAKDILDSLSKVALHQVFQLPAQGRLMRELSEKAEGQ